MKDGFDGPNGLFMYTAAPVFPTGSFNSSNYWVDVVFSSTDGTQAMLHQLLQHNPASQNLCAGTIATFTSAASGTPTPTVQWQVSSNGTNWSNINGATNATLSFTVVAGDNGKQFRAVWTNSTSSVNSDPATLTVNAIPASPGVSVANSCGSSVLTANSFSGSLLWSTGATTSSISVTTAGTYTVTQTVNGCKSPARSVTAAPSGVSVAAPRVTVVNNCSSSTLSASGYTGSLLWSNGATTSSITVTTAGTYTVTQKVNGCTSAAGSGIAAPRVPTAPTITVANNCGSSILTASGYTGSLLWSNGATTASITVTAAGTYTVRQTVNGCTSATRSATAAPVVVPAAPTITVVNTCGGSTLTANGYTGSLLWSNGATTASITVAAAGTYTVKQTVNGCTSAIRSAYCCSIKQRYSRTNCDSRQQLWQFNPYSKRLYRFSVVEYWCNNSINYSNTAGTYTVTQKINTCTSPARSVTAAPKVAPTLNK